MKQASLIFLSICSALMPISAQTTLMLEDFETGSLNQFSNGNVINTLSWQTTTNRGGDPGHSASNSAYFGNTATFNYDTGSQEGASLTSGPISLSSDPIIHMTFNYFMHVENSSNYDILSVQVSTDGVTYNTLSSNGASGQLIRNSGGWHSSTVDLSTYSSSTIYIRFDFNTIDGSVNAQEGVYVDDIHVFVPEDSYFTKTIGTTNGEYLKEVIQTSDGNLVYVGEISVGSDRQMWLVKTNLQGDTLWTKELGSANQDQGYTVTELNDGRLFIGGKVTTSDNDPGFIICNSNATAISTTRAFQASGFGEFIRSSDLMNDGNIIVSGDYNDGTYTNAFVAKVSTTGTTLWQRNWSDAANRWQYANSVDATADGGAILFASGNGSAAGDWTGYLAKYSSTGNLEFQKYMQTGGGYDQFTSGVQTSDGGYIAVGNSDHLSSGDNDIWVVRFNSTGDVMWSKSYGASTNDRSTDIIETNDNGFVITGHTYTSGGTDDFGVMLKINSTGVLQWSKKYGGSGIDKAYGVTELINGDLIMTGECGSFGGGYADGYIIRTNSEGEQAGCSFDVQFTELTHAISSQNLSFTATTTINNTFASSYIENIGLSCIDPVPSNTMAITPPLCYGETGTVDLTISGGVAPFAYQWSNGATSQDLLNEQAGGYYVDIVDNLGCVTRDSVVMVEPTQITSSLSGTNVTCFASGDGSVDLNVSGGTPNYSFHWSNAATTEDLSNLPGGFYQVTITDDNGCTDVVGITVTEPSPLSVGISNTSNISCNGLCDGSITAIASGGTGTIDYLWNDGASQSTAAANGLCQGTYLVTVSDDNGCTNIVSGNILEPTAISANITTTGSECQQQNGTASAMASGGTGSLAYMWSSGNTSSSETGLTPGNYNLTITDDNGCAINESVVINDFVQTIDPCVITVSNNNKNQIVWEKPVQNGIMGFNIYRDVTGTYIPVGYVPYDSLSEFEDLNPSINPSLTSYRYKIAVEDSCGNESDLGAFHETIHLTNNVGTSGEVNLIWDTYEGFAYSYYRILRDSTGTGNWEVLDSVSNFNFTYTDITPPVANSAYLVEVVAPSSCTSTRANHNTTRSNKTQPITNPGSGNGIESLISETFKLYPNPNQGDFKISFKSMTTKNSQLKLYTVSGAMVLQQSLEIQRGNNEISMSLQELAPGIYFVEINEYTRKRFVVSQ